MPKASKDMTQQKKNTERESSFSKSILKTLSILEQYSEADELGIKELSENTGIPASTVQRIVNTLVMKQYLVQNPSTLKYRLGIAFFNISSRYSNSRDWVDVAKAHMEKQVAVTKETVNLAILQGKTVVYLAKEDSPNILRPNFSAGTPYSAINSALGRCLLAHQPWEKVERLIKDDPNLHRSLDDYHKMLQDVVTNGYAVEDEEFQPGLFCIGAPIFDAENHVVAAMSTSIPKIRLDDDIKRQNIIITKDTANKISMDIKKSFQYIEVDRVAARINGEGTP